MPYERRAPTKTTLIILAIFGLLLFVMWKRMRSDNG